MLIDQIDVITCEPEVFELLIVCPQATGRQVAGTRHYVELVGAVSKPQLGMKALCALADDHGNHGPKTRESDQR